jgi:hypothetical protein
MPNYTDTVQLCLVPACQRVGDRWWVDVLWLVIEGIVVLVFRCRCLFGVDQCRCTLSQIRSLIVCRYIRTGVVRADVEWALVWMGEPGS